MQLSPVRELMLTAFVVIAEPSESLITVHEQSPSLVLPPVDVALRKTACVGGLFVGPALGPPCAAEREMYAWHAEVRSALQGAAATPPARYCVHTTANADRETSAKSAEITTR